MLFVFRKKLFHEFTGIFWSRIVQATLNLLVNLPASQESATLFVRSFPVPTSRTLRPSQRLTKIWDFWDWLGLLVQELTASTFFTSPLPFRSRFLRTAETLFLCNPKKFSNILLGAWQSQSGDFINSKHRKMLVCDAFLKGLTDRLRES